MSSEIAEQATSVFGYHSRSRSVFGSTQQGAGSRNGIPGEPHLGRAERLSSHRTHDLRLEGSTPLVSLRRQAPR